MSEDRNLILVCQRCGRTALAGTSSPHWLQELHRDLDGTMVIRCPQHWSDWALRNTVCGRTKVMRMRMSDARQQPESQFPAWLDPYPNDLSASEHQW